MTVKVGSVAGLGGNDDVSRGDGECVEHDAEIAGQAVLAGDDHCGRIDGHGCEFVVHIDGFDFNCGKTGVVGVSC